MGTHQVKLIDVVPVCNKMGEALNGVPLSLAAAACLVMAYTIINGEAPNGEMGVRMIKDFSELMGMWEMEPQA